MGGIKRFLELVARSTQASATAAEAVKKVVEDKKTNTTDWSKLITKPNSF